MQSFIYNIDISAVGTAVATVIAAIGGAFGAYTVVLEKLKQNYKKDHEKQIKDLTEIWTNKFTELKSSYEDKFKFQDDRIALLESESSKMDIERSKLIVEKSNSLRKSEDLKLEIEKIKTDYLKIIQIRDQEIITKDEQIANLLARLDSLELQNQEKNKRIALLEKEVKELKKMIKIK